jgi:hypothetical protein
MTARLHVGWPASILCLTLGLCITFATPARSHHGLATYDVDRQVTLEGTVTEFRFSNPHVTLHVEVKDKQGGVVNWSLEGSGAYYWSRAGWTATSLKRGDRVTVTLAPSKAGGPMGLLSKLVLPNGRELSMGR